VYDQRAGSVSTLIAISLPPLPFNICIVSLPLFFVIFIFSIYYYNQSKKARGFKHYFVLCHVFFTLNIVKGNFERTDLSIV